MNHRTTIFAVLVLVLLAATNAAAATPCENLVNLRLPNARIDSGQMVAAGGFVQPGRGGGARGGANSFANLPAFCRVTATLVPTSDSDIKVEMWLPVSGWNGKFQVVGNGGLGGSIPYH